MQLRGIQAIVWDLDETLADTRFLKAARDRRDWSYCRRRMGNVKPFRGILSSFRALSTGFGSAVVTNSPRWYTESVLNEIGIVPDKIIAYGDTTRHKPDPQPILLAAKLLRLPIASCVIIGDSEKDFLAGRAAGAHFIGVTWGELTREELDQLGVRLIVERPSEIVTLLGESC